MAQVWNIWKFGYRPFQEAGTDTFILATPQGNMLWTSDPSVCSQLETQHPKSQVAVDMVKFFEVYGPTVGTVEGDEWKNHRRVIVSGFNPSTNAAVWKETTEQTSSLIDRLLQQGGIVPVMKHWTSRLALHVVSAVFFRKSLNWDEYTRDSEPAPPGHQISYERALFTVLTRLGVLYVTPRPLLRVLPMKRFREANLAFIEWTKYMQELSDETIARPEEIVTKKTKSILGTSLFVLEKSDLLLRTSYRVCCSCWHIRIKANRPSSSVRKKYTWKHLLHDLSGPRDDWQHFGFRAHSLGRVSRVSKKDSR